MDARSDSRDDLKPVRSVLGTVLKEGFPQFLGFEVLLRILTVVIFAPLSAWLATRLIAWSGNGAISNYDLAGFFLSVNGFLYLTVVVTIAFTLVFFEFAGLVSLAISLLRGNRIRLPQLFRFLIVSLPRLWRLATRQFLIYLAIAAPCLAVTGAAYLVFLTKNDIYYYLDAKPPAFWYAVGLAGTAGLVFAFFAIRQFVDWIYSVPLLLLTDHSPAEALRESRRMVAGRRKEVILLMLRTLGAVAAMLLATWLLMAALKFVLLGLAGTKVGLVLTMVAVLGVLHFLVTAVIGILAMAGVSTGVAQRFLVLRPDARLPETPNGDQRSLEWPMVRFLRAGWVVCLVLAICSGLLAVRLASRIEIEEKVGITAHRGSSITAPENTMAAILLALDEGSDYVEIDVQETKDGTVVLAHDKDLKRVFDIDKGIWEVTYGELRDLDSGGWFDPKFSDQRLVTLSDAIQAVKGRAMLNIELKFNGHQQKLATEVVRIVKENGFDDQCVLTSLDYDGLRRAQEAGPKLRTGIIVTSSIGDITKLEADLLSISAKAATRDLIDQAQRKGLEVHVWTVNEVAHMNTMINLGVDNIITDDPKLLGEVLAHRAGLDNSEKAFLQLIDIVNGWF